MSQEPLVLGGRYEVGELIGRGGMAEVHAGYDLRLGRTVAIKILRSDLARDTSFLARFRREAQAAAGLNHPAIVAVYDSGEQESTESGGAPVHVPYIVMERIEGRTLRDLLNDEKMLDPDEAARITASVLTALEFSHERGIVHRDIKPANVMVTRGGAVKVMDFGIARALADTAATMTQTQAVLGTARYLSPEQAQGQDVDARSDLYSAGCLLYELLTGRTPFVGDPVSLVYQHLGEAPKAPSAHQNDLTRELDAIVLHALQKSPDQRYQSAVQFRDDLTAARQLHPISKAAEETFERVGLAAGATGAIPPPGSGEAEAGMAGATEAIPTGDGAAGVQGRAGRPPYDGHGEPPYVQSQGGERFGPDEWERTDEIPVREERRHRGGYLMLATLGLLALAAVGWAVFQALGPSRSPVDPSPAQVNVPLVIGKTEQQATAKLAEFKLKTVPEQRADKAPAGRVIDQNPQANTPVAEGSNVTITISSGSEAQVIPDLEGYEEPSARNILKEMGLTVKKEARKVDDPKFDKDRVVGTDPGKGTEVTAEDQITLIVASGKVAVPDVLNNDANLAIATLTVTNRLTYDITYRGTSKVAPNKVLEQSIEAGTVVDYGTEVVLVVSREPRATVTATPIPPPPPKPPPPPPPPPPPTITTTTTTTSTSTSPTSTSPTSTSPTSTSTTTTTSSSSPPSDTGPTTGGPKPTAAPTVGPTPTD